MIRDISVVDMKLYIMHINPCHYPDTATQANGTPLSAAFALVSHAIVLIIEFLAYLS